MRLSTGLLMVTWVPLIQLQLFRFESYPLEQGIDIIFIIFYFLLYAAAVWVVKKKYPIGIGVRNSILRLLIVMSILTALFGVPVLWGIIRVFGFERPEDLSIPPTVGIMFLAVSVALCCAALVSVWREMRETDKPYGPVVKFVLASTFLLWQFNLGIRFYYDLPMSLIRNFSWDTDYSEFFGHLVMVKSILFIGYFILNILFFGRIFFKGTFKERQPLFFAGSGLAMVLGTYLLVLFQVTVARLFQTYIHAITIALTFVTVIGGVLVIALVMASFGGILAFFKNGFTHKPVPAPVRRKALVLSLFTIGLYLALFGGIWPVQDPSMAVLMREIKKSEDYFKCAVVIYDEIGVDSCREFLYFGRTAVKPLINYLNHEDEFVQSMSIALLSHLGDKRAVEPLIEKLKDKKFLRNAASALVHIKDKRAVSPLIAALKEKKFDPMDIECLGELGDPRMIDALLEELKNKDSDYMVGALEALSYVKEVKVVDALIKTLQEEGPERRRSYIDDALGRMTGASCKVKEDEMPEWWRDWWEKNRDEIKEKFEGRREKKSLNSQ